LEWLLDMATCRFIDAYNYQSKSESLEPGLFKVKAEQADMSHRVRHWYKIVKET
jgi:hypothetical protein